VTPVAPGILIAKPKTNQDNSGNLIDNSRKFRKQTVMKAKTKNLSSALLPDAFGLIPVVIVCLALTPVLQIEALTTGLQKLTARLEVETHAPNVVLADP
jgi:hypothetical protein